MRPAFRPLLSTTSLAALAALAGTAIVSAPALGVSVNVDTTIDSATTDQQSLDTAGVDLTVTNSASVTVSTGPAVILNKASTTLTVGVVSGSPSGVGLVNGTSGNIAVQVNGFTGLAITTNTNGTIQADGVATINVAATAGLTINNRGAISNIGTTSGDAAIALASSTVTINNTRLNPGDTLPGITALSGAAIEVNGTITGAIVNEGTISTANKNGYTGGAINLGTGASVSGGLNNKSTGIVQGAAGGDAITLSTGSTLAITNAGTIQQVNGGAGGAAIHVLGTQTSTITNQSGATISATGTGAAAGAIVLSGGGTTQVTGSIQNAGTITASGSGAAAVNFVTGGSISGGISNLAGGTISATGSAAAALSLIGDGGIASATITNAAAAGATPAGRITNGSSGGVAAIFIDARNGGGTAQVTVSNSGRIDVTGTGDAIRVSATNSLFTLVTVNNLAGGVIEATNSTDAAAHAINFTGPVTANGTTPVLDNSGTITGNKGATVLVAGALTPGGGQFGIANRVGGTISNAAVAGVALDVQAAVGGGIDNAGTISAATAIAQTAALTNTINNRATGAITGAVQVAQGTFNIFGGTVAGATTGGNASTVNFTLTPVSIASYGSFDPVNDPVGFGTGGSIALTTGATSSINVTSGAVGIDHNLTAQAVNIAAGAAMVWNDQRQAGGTTITTGTLTNNGMLAILGGTTGTYTGTVAGNLVSNGTILAIGLVHGNGTTNVPSINLTGTGAFNGNAVLRVYNDYADYTAAGSHTIVKSTGALTVAGVTDTNGTFLGVDGASDTAVLTYAALTTPNGGTGTGRTITMTIGRTGYDQIGGLVGANERRLGGALEAIGADTGHSPVFAPLLGWLDSQATNAPIQDALKRMVPIANGAALYGSALGMNSLLQSVDGRLANFGNQSVDATPGFAGVGSRTGATGRSGAAGGARNGVWVRLAGGTGSQGDQNAGGSRVDGFGFNSWNLALGADREIREDIRVGVSLAYGKTKADGDDIANSKLDIRTYQAAFYGAWRGGPWFATGIVGGAANAYEGERTVAFGPFSGKPTADYSGWQFTMKAVAGIETYPAWAGSIQIAPYGSLRYSHIHIGEYRERGGGVFNAKVDSQGYDQFVPGVGVRFAKPFQAGALTLLPWLRPELGFDLVGARQKLDAAFAAAPGTGFTTEGIRPARTTFSLAGGVNVFTKGNFSASLTGEWQTGVGASFNSVSGFGQIKYQF